MPIPALIDGWLPPGEHSCDLDEIRAHFGGPTHHAVRQQVFKELKSHLRSSLVVDYVDHVYVNGSFASDREMPGDVDVLLGLKPGVMAQLMATAIVNPASVVEALQGRFTAVVNGKRLVHGFVDEIDGPVYRKARAYFQRSDRIGEPQHKGILRVEIR